jgi:hypothetical protein
VSEILSLATSQTLVVGATYSISQLLPLMFKDDVNGRNFADGKLFNVGDVLEEITSYSRWNSISALAVATALGLIIIANLSCLNDEKHGWVIVNAVSIPIIVGCIIIGFLAGVGGCAAQSLALQGEGGYTSDLTYLYLLWVVLMYGLPISLFWANRATRRFFRAMF